MGLKEVTQTSVQQGPECTAGSWALEALLFDTRLGWAPSGRKMEDELTLVDKVTSRGESCMSEDREVETCVVHCHPGGKKRETCGVHCHPGGERKASKAEVREEESIGRRP